MQEDFKSIRRLRYALPEVIEPATSICIKVNVPNDIAYLAAFWGQMFALTRWYAWLPDSAHTGKDVAARWRTVYEQAQESECENVLVRTSPVNDCLLQVSYDGGALWETVYNAYGCALKAAGDEFGSGSNQPASKSQPGEQPGGATPEPGQCFDLDLTVPAVGQTLIPIKVGAGWTLTLTNVKGAWSDDNGLTALWSCPNGYPFSLGACGSGGVPAHETDPLSTAYHMQLLLWQPDNTFIGLQDSVAYTVPSGMAEGNYLLLCNDGDRSNNQGAASLHLQACNYRRTAHLSYVADSGHGTISGPSEVLEGDEFTLSWTVGSDPFASGGVDFDGFANVTLLAITGWTNSQATSHCYRYPPGSSYSCGGGQPPQPANATNWIGCNSATDFTMHFRLNSIT